MCDPPFFDLNAIAAKITRLKPLLIGHLQPHKTQFTNDAYAKGHNDAFPKCASWYHSIGGRSCSQHQNLSPPTLSNRETPGSLCI
jgi:hypothetical protein